MLALSKSIASHESLEIAILHLMNEYSFSLSTLEQVLLDQSLDVSFSRVKYTQVAPFVGLDPAKRLLDIGTFELHRSRIPTNLFKSIIEDMDLVLMQYGPPLQHSTEEATSRFLSPIFNRLVAEFGFTFRNLLKGCITRGGRIEYSLKAFGAVSILVLEVKLRGGNNEERLDAITRVIAECDAYDWNNSTQNFSVPVFGILWDGSHFYFFRFDGTSKPSSFLRGAFSADPLKFRNGIKLPDLIAADENALPFIRAVRLISEAIFDLLLSGYVSSIEAFRDRS
ncbi:hypothetical protein APHAL10511_000669 [Amanita phalloides]|nr:hypothetical protein APHAL10511_000669 [Amanita phalloides]